MPTGNMHGLVVRPLAGLANWAFDFEYELQIATWDQNNQTLAVLSPHGSSYLFKRDASGNMVPNNDGVDVVPQHDYKLSYDGAWPSDVTGIQSAQTIWILQDSQDRVWYLQSRKDPATNRWLIAQPVRMVEPGGRELKFLYGFQNELDSITDSNGNQITFEWQWTTLPAAISVAHLPGGDSIHYVYESIGSDNSNPDRLIRVEFKDASGAIVDKASYAYGDARFPLFVTQIRDRDDVVRWAVTYDEQGHATSSSGPFGTKQYTVAYTPIGPTFTRTVTNPFGRTSTYNFVNTGGYGLKLTSVTGAATANAPASTTGVGIATDYSIASVTDAENRATAYTRDTGGRPTQVVEAQGTAQARTTNLTWRTDSNRPTQIVAPGLTTDFGYTAGSSAGPYVPPSSGGSHRFWRVRSSNTASSGYLGIAELQMHSTVGGSDLTTGKTAIASAAYYPAARAINDNAADFWTTGSTAPPSGGHWLAVDLGPSAAVNEIVITVRPDSYREDPLNLFVDSSDDNATWTNQWSIATIATWSAGQTRTFENPNTIAPIFSVPPTACGNPIVGGTLVGTSGSHSGTSETYRWLTNGVAIPGATTPNYVVTSADAGHVLVFEVTATDPAGSTVATSPPITAGAPAHCYWRIRSSSTSSSGYLGIAEMEMRPTPGGNDQTAGNTAAASATYIPVSAHPPAYAINDNRADFWTTGGTTPPTGGHWLSVKFGASVSVAEVVLTVRPDTYREDPRNLFVEWSDDNSVWNTEWSVSSIAAWAAGETRTFTKP
jgi:hypothetical protein